MPGAVKNILILVISIGFASCGDDGINLFTVEDDLALGAQLREQILEDSSFVILDRSQYITSYQYLEEVVQEILNSGQVEHKDEFAWEVHLVHDDSTLNAFAAPGGFIFVYTGLIKFLDTKDDFVGVMGHEMAHADRRHSTQQLTQRYGIGLLLSVLSGGDPSTLVQILGSLVSLKFSRSDESEADRYSVIYLCETPYAANGAASFFEKLTAQGTVSPPAFLSTHPNPDDRVQAINEIAEDRGCDTAFNSNAGEWNGFKNSLPN
ncbi:MAG: M48 family metalloprotease [Saprospiraceae bacterium]|nr:M48 family metalloprotease [Saprospiraceae bacterium]